jgi:osmotically-inducible protein OsmY
MKTHHKKRGAIVTSFLLLSSVALAKATNTPATAALPKDNTAVNARDNKAITADEQAYGSDRDVEITRMVRQEIVSHKGLSAYAQNVKIVTLGGKVFLRGPVRNQQEKAQIKADAEKVAGAQNVKDELEIVAK